MKPAKGRGKPSRAVTPYNARSKSEDRRAAAAPAPTLGFDGKPTARTGPMVLLAVEVMDYVNALGPDYKAEQRRVAELGNLYLLARDVASDPNADVGRARRRAILLIAEILLLEAGGDA